MKTIIIDGIEYTLTPVTQPEKPSGKRWRAELGEKYYSTDSCGEILVYTEKNSKYESYAYNSGNYYKTEAEAERARDKQLALVRITDKLREIEADVGWVIDWENDAQEKYIVSYNHVDNKFECAFDLYCQLPVNDMHSCKRAIDYVIKHMQDDLKLIFDINS